MTSSPPIIDPVQRPPAPAPHRWLPKRVLVTAAAYEQPHGRVIVERCARAGVPDIDVLRGNRLPSLRAEDERRTYALAKSTLAVVTSSEGKRRLQPIPPSADWSFSIAEGCPAHCQYCYLAGSLAGPPLTRVYADLPRILAGLDPYVGRGDVTSTSPRRAGEGTTFAASCYTDPLALEHLTGSMSAAVAHFGAHEWPGPVQLRFTTKFADVDPLLGLAHHGRARVRMSVTAAAVSRRFEGGTDPLAARIDALARLAGAGFPVGLTIAPIMPVPGWREEYASLLDDVAAALAGSADLDLTVECITHRFTPKSKQVQLGWYPRTRLDLDEEKRSVKRGRFRAVKHVYQRETMAELRGWFSDALPQRLPAARWLYWT